MTEHVLAAIDAAIDDWEVSGDAMRITYAAAFIAPPVRTAAFHGVCAWPAAVQEVVQEYAETIAESMNRLGAVLSAGDVAAVLHAFGLAEHEQPVPVTPARRTRHPVYSDNRPRHVTPYGPRPRRRA